MVICMSVISSCEEVLKEMFNYTDKECVQV